MSPASAPTLDELDPRIRDLLARFVSGWLSMCAVSRSRLTSAKLAREPPQLNGHAWSRQYVHLSFMVGSA
jgi:hypothetical protein